MERTQHGVREDAPVIVEWPPERRGDGPQPAGQHVAIPSSRAARSAAALVVVVILAVAAGLWAVVGSQRIFPYLSDDHDEGLYLLQAEAVAEGHVFPPAPPEHADAFRPWLSVLDGDRYILKYAPVHASLLAVGVRLAGSARLSLGFIAAGVVLLSFALGQEVLRDRWAAVAAAAFLALSPLFLVQSATFLPYCSSLLLLLGFSFALLRGWRLDARPLLAVGGFVFGLALFARPFDALLWAAPLVLYVVISGRADLRRLARTAGWFALGAALPVIAMLLYYRAATGSPFRSPFNLLEPEDTLGFGPRRLLPGQPELLFTPAHGVYGVVRYAFLTSLWGFGGLVLVGFFLGGLLRRRMEGPQPWLIVAGLTYACGYLFFWGTFGTSLKGSLTSFIGPFYFLPVLAPVTLVAASGFAALWRHDRFIAVSAFAGMVLVSGYLLAKSLDVNLMLTDQDRRIYAPIAAAPLDDAVVFLPPMWGPHLLHPFAHLQNDADYDGRVVYALDRGERKNLDLLDDRPGRQAYRLRLQGGYRAIPTDPELGTYLEWLAVVKRPVLDASLTFHNPTDQPYVVVTVTHNGVRESFVVDTSSERGKHHEVPITVSSDSVEVPSAVERRIEDLVEYDGVVSISVSVASGADEERQTIYERHIAFDTERDGLRLLLPGTVSVNALEGEDPMPSLTARAPRGCCRRGP